MSILTSTLLSLWLFQCGLTLLWPAIWPWDPCWCGLFYSFHPFGLSLTPLQPLLGHVAFLITTIVGCLSFLCHPHGCCPQSAMVLLQPWAGSPKGWPHSFSFLKVFAALISVLKRVALFSQALLDSSLEDLVSVVYCWVTKHPQN